eukprot:TRINITY_DN1361_c0_g1_i1.p1 TRINITY_DN1361_c0_g1~~TRINITY_DN1361_c0_g1_i1.p1  ORF type:complete len:367 (+),score=79.89 TRINITY_DN1361_c0_g1_i1:36-1103(+)
MAVHDQKMNSIDLRSDTVSWPTLEMRLAMANAKVGDDVLGDDETILQLQSDAAAMFGKEAALFVPSGTQANLLAILAHTKRGEEAIMGNMSHTFLFEAAGVSAVAGVMPRTLIVQEDGTLQLEDIQNAIRIKDDHQPTTSLIILENTQERKGAIPLTVEYTNTVAQLVHKHDIKLHIDGARIFNAATALGVDVKELVKNADSVSLCLSKGLCAPVGSILCGTKQFILEAKRKRKMLGGSLRQSGILAAAGLISLHKMSKRLAEDHTRAQQLHQGLTTIPFLKVKPVYTNMVWFQLIHPTITAHQLSTKLLNYNIKLQPNTGNHFRCAIHYWINDENVKTVVKAIAEILKNNSNKL